LSFARFLQTADCDSALFAGDADEGFCEQVSLAFEFRLKQHRVEIPGYFA
jgi:hypothetical protein